jgi:hypothetical protein
MKKQSVGGATRSMTADVRPCLDKPAKTKSHRAVTGTATSTVELDQFLASHLRTVSGP